METKIIPFDIEIAKQIQAGEIEGRIVTNEGNEVEIIRFDLIQNSFPILAIIHIPNVVSDYWKDAKLFQLNGKHGNESLWLEIELPEETPEHEFKVGDKVTTIGSEIIWTIKEIKNGKALIFADGPCGCARVELRKLKLYKENHEFKPYDKVLVRYIDRAKWIPRLFEGYGSQNTFLTQDGGIWNQCIPYEGNEHLVGTTDKPKEE